jgi:hypothetical protein
VRLWLGFGNIEPGVNVYDLTGANYRGFGEIQNVPAFKQLVNGKAERVEFTVSGVSGEILTVIASGVTTCRTGQGQAGLCRLCADGAAMGAARRGALVRQLRRGLSGDCAATPDDPFGSVVRTVTLSCGTIMTGRRRPSYSYFSPIRTSRRATRRPVLRAHAALRQQDSTRHGRRFRN